MGGRPRRGGKKAAAPLLCASVARHQSGGREGERESHRVSHKKPDTVNHIYLTCLLLRSTLHTSPTITPFTQSKVLFMPLN